MKKVIADHKRANRLFIFCWIAYFCSYVGRYNFSASMAEMIPLGVITQVEAGTINMIFFITYACGRS